MSDVQYLFSNEHYDVVIGKSVEFVDDAREVYLVINKNTHLTETESPILPQAITWANDFNESLQVLEESKEDRPIFQH